MAMSIRTNMTRMTTRSPVAPRVTRSSVMVRAQVKIVTSSDAIAEAQSICESGTAKECTAAWDNVEKVVLEEEFQMKQRLKMMRKAAEDRFAYIAAKAKSDKSDPLEQFCEGNPDADECRVYED